MIDLHSHILPGLDDGAADLDEALAMARLAVADGMTAMTCTPHIHSGVYDNNGKRIAAAVAALRLALQDAGIPLQLYVGADTHIAPDLASRLTTGLVPTLNGSRYFLLEPPHHVVPPRIEDLAMQLLRAGFVPVITHPERLTWIARHYEVIERLNAAGCLIQLTADSLTGGFGRFALYYAERLLDEGRCDIVASDAHGVRTRRPQLSRARDRIIKRIGEQEAMKMVLTVPAAILADRTVLPARATRPVRTGPRPQKSDAPRRPSGVTP